MPKTKISEFSSNPANNTDIDSINIAEGCSPSGINDAIRELMAQLKDWQSGTSNDPYVVGSSGSLTLNQGAANGVAYLNGSKVVTSGSALTFDGTSLGVGTASPSGRLHVANTGTAGTTADNLAVYFTSTNRNSNVYIRAKNTEGSVLNFADGDSDVVGRIAYEHPDNTMRFDASGSEQMRLTSTGLGIGTSSPIGKLGVVSGAVPNIATLYVGLSGSNNYYDANTHYFRNGSQVDTMTLTSTGLGIGTSSPATKLEVTGDIGGTWTSGATRFVGSQYLTGSSYQLGMKTTMDTRETQIFAKAADTGGYVTIATGITPTERARIDSSGNLLLNTTSSRTGVNSISIEPSGNNYIEFRKSGSGSSTQIQFNRNTDTTPTSAGSISTTGTTASYNTSSDYRLKQDIAPITNALDKVTALKPVTFKWNTDGSDGEGFIAHELAEVCPQAVNGVKDAVDEEGNPIYQGIDTSFLVATLTAALQELNAKFDAYVASHP